MRDEPEFRRLLDRWATDHEIATAANMSQRNRTRDVAWEGMFHIASLMGQLAQNNSQVRIRTIGGQKYSGEVSEALSDAVLIKANTMTVSNYRFSLCRLACLASVEVTPRNDSSEVPPKVEHERTTLWTRSFLSMTQELAASENLLTIDFADGVRTHLCEVFGVGEDFVTINSRTAPKASLTILNIHAIEALHFNAIA